MARPLRLTGQDTFLYGLDGPKDRTFTGRLLTFEPGSADRLDLETVRAWMDDRTRFVARMRQRVHSVPGQIGRPLLVPDPAFDIRAHIETIGIAAPGGTRELAAFVGPLMDEPLGDDRPLWRMWLLTGLADGRVALLIKAHHCLWDGEGWLVVLERLLDGGDRRFEMPRNEPNLGVPAPPGPELVARSLSGLFLRSPPVAGRVLSGGARQARVAVGMARRQELPFGSAPHTTLNGDLCGHTSWATMSLALDDMKRVYRAFGVTHNALALAMAADAAMELIEAKGPLPDRPLIATVPIRVVDRGTLRQPICNCSSLSLVDMATTIPDPVERLRAIHHNARRSREMVLHLRKHRRAGAGQLIPPLVYRSLSAAAHRSGVHRRRATANLAISNVRGPAAPLKLGGCKVEALSPNAPVSAGSGGFTLALFTYLDRTHFGLHVDDELVPDVWAPIATMQASFDRLSALAQSQATQSVAGPRA